MSGKRYPEEFRIEAVKQVTECGYSVTEVAKRLGVTTKTLYEWKDKYGGDPEQRKKEESLSDEVRRLQKELKRVTQERDILKEAAAFFANESRSGTRS